MNLLYCITVSLYPSIQYTLQNTYKIGDFINGLDN